MRELPKQFLRETMTQPQRTVVIIGGGIGGLFAANALIAHGLRVSVYEQAPALGEIGAGVFLTPNSVRQLQRVGLGAGGGEVGRPGRPELPLFPPRWRADRAGAGDRLVGLERDLRHAPRRPRRDAGRAHCRRASCIPATAASASSRTATPRAYRSPTAPSPKPTSSSRADGIHSELRPHVSPPSRPVFSRLRRLSRPRAARARSALADRPLADVARQGQALPGLSGARRRAHQLCRLRAGGRGDEGILVGARRSRRAARANSRAGTRASERC